MFGGGSGRTTRTSRGLISASRPTVTGVNAAIFEEDSLPLRESSTILRLDVKGVTKLSDEYKLYLFSPEVVIPPGKSERLNDDLTMEHRKHLLEKHGSRIPGSPKPHSRRKLSQRKLGFHFFLRGYWVWNWNWKYDDVTHLYFSKLF